MKSLWKVALAILYTITYCFILIRISWLFIYYIVAYIETQTCKLFFEYIVLEYSSRGAEFCSFFISVCFLTFRFIKKETLEPTTSLKLYMKWKITGIEKTLKITLFLQITTNSANLSLMKEFLRATMKILLLCLCHCCLS